MEFQDRQPTNPGRVTLKNVSTGVQATYDVTFADGATVGGTPLSGNLFINSNKPFNVILSNRGSNLLIKKVFATGCKGKKKVCPSVKKTPLRT